MSNLEQMIADKRAIRVEKEEEKRIKDYKIFQDKCEELKPMLEKLEALKAYGYNVKLHTDKKHFPCPAIHARHERGTVNYDNFGEIFLSRDDNKWKSGGCNSHNNSHKTDEDLLEFIATKIAEKH
jgi:hypothetical protein